MSTTTIPILPHIPAVRDDELLGSWFSRIASANQAATWNLLLNRCGYEINFQPPVDIGLPNERYELLCRALGKSYTSLTLEMTTLPFWLVFEASSNNYLYDGKVKIPARDIAGRGSSGTMKVRGKLGNLKYCPYCLQEQIARGIGTYWRRSHQLPVSIFCHEHHILLRSACFSCGRIPELIKRRILKMPEHFCFCGANLTAPPPASLSPLNARFDSLAQFAFEALNNGLPTWDRSHVLAAALAIIGDERRGKIIEVFDALEGYFGFERYGKYGLRYFIPEVHSDASPLVLQGVPSAWTASTFAAFFVAAGISFAKLRDILGERPLTRGRLKGLGINRAFSGEVRERDRPKTDNEISDKPRPRRSWNLAQPIKNTFLSSAVTFSPIREKKLFEVLQRILANQAQPSLVRMSELALAFGASESRLRKIIALAPAFNEEFARVNKAYREERIRWKFRQLADAQRSVSMSTLLNEISLMRTSSNCTIVLAVAKEQPSWSALVRVQT